MLVCTCVFAMTVWHFYTFVAVCGCRLGSLLDFSQIKKGKTAECFGLLSKSYGTASNAKEGEDRSYFLIGHGQHMCNCSIHLPYHLLIYMDLTPNSRFSLYPAHFGGTDDCFTSHYGIIYGTHSRSGRKGDMKYILVSSAVVAVVVVNLMSLSDLRSLISFFPQP